MSAKTTNETTRLVYIVVLRNKDDETIRCYGYGERTEVALADAFSRACVKFERTDWDFIFWEEEDSGT